jgi:hypothetical protein
MVDDGAGAKWLRHKKIVEISWAIETKQQLRRLLRSGSAVQQQSWNKAIETKPLF